LTILCVALVQLAGSIPAPATVGWLPISPEDLALKDNPKQPGADAMVLYRESLDDARKSGTDGDSIEEYIRIKIFTQAGTRYGHVEVSFDKSFEGISYVAGRTIRPDGTVENFDGKVLEATVVKFGDLKELVKTFTLPDVQPGCIIEYKYTRQAYPNWVHNHVWDIAGDLGLYTREAHFSYFPYQGYGGLGLTPVYLTYGLPAGLVPKLQSDSSYTMVVRDVPATVDEALMPPKQAIEPHVAFLYLDPSDPSPDEPTDKFWNQYAKKWDGQLERFVDKKSALSQELAKIVGPNDAPEVKLRKIYDRMYQIRNLSMEDYKSQKEDKAENLKDINNVEDVLRRGYGSEQHINFLFVGLARAAGFDSTEVYAAPRSGAPFSPSRRDPSVITADFVWVHAGSKEYFLDPGARYYPFGVLPWNETSASGIRVDKHAATFVTTPNPVSSDATLVRTADLQLRNDGSVSGTLQIDFTGLEGANLRLSERQEDETGRRKYLADVIKGWLPVGSSFEVTKIAAWDDVEQPLHVEGTVKIPSFAGAAMQHMLLPLDLFQATNTAAFAPEKRSNAIYFHFPYEEIDDVKLHAPSGYKIDSLPMQKKLDLGAEFYEISVTAEGDTVEVRRHLAQKGMLFSPDQYPTLRAFFAAVRTNDNAQMVLSNTQSAKNN
jgi:transglutaminase-like putative cysteine protease